MQVRNGNNRRTADFETTDAKDREGGTFRLDQFQESVVDPLTFKQEAWDTMTQRFYTFADVPITRYDEMAKYNPLVRKFVP
jgi:hypothetical protein